MPIRRIIVAVLAFGVLAAACSSDGSTDALEDTVTDEAAAQSSDETTTTAAAPATTDADTSAPGVLAQDGDIVDVHYVGTLDDGSQFDSSRERGTALTFTLGSGEVISGFDDAVRGAKVGDVNTVRMEAADAYGEPSDEFIIDVPFNPEQGDIEVGDQVYLNNGQPATILAITDESVTLDANHPLAGEALTFEIEVLAITRG